MSEPRIHTIHVTPEALRRLVETHGAHETANMVRQMVIDAGLDGVVCTWEGGKGRGVTIRGPVPEGVEMV